MEHAAVRQAALRLPIIELDGSVEDYEMWEGFDGLARFRLTRYAHEDKPSLDVYIAQLAGPKEDRDRLAADFISALGQPTSLVSVTETNIHMIHGQLIDKT